MEANCVGQMILWWCMLTFFKETLPFRRNWSRERKTKWERDVLYILIGRKERTRERGREREEREWKKSISFSFSPCVTSCGVGINRSIYIFVVVQPLSLSVFLFPSVSLSVCLPLHPSSPSANAHSSLGTAGPPADRNSNELLEDVDGRCPARQDVFNFRS